MASRPEIPGRGGAGRGPGHAAPPWTAPRPREPAGSTGPFLPAQRGGGGEKPPGGPPPAGRRPPAGNRTGLAATLAVAAVALAVSLTGLTAQILPRALTARQRQQIAAWEMSKRWRDWPAGRMFPARIGYQLPGSLFGGGQPVSLVARRVGIAPQAPCRSAVDAAAARVLAREGCLAVLRATYDDATQTLAVTIGVIVLPGPGAAQAALKALPVRGEPRPGLRAVAFPRTPTAWFGRAPRQEEWQADAGPYLVLATAGYADGRSRAPQSAGRYTRGELASLASGAGRAVADALGAQPRAPRCPGGPAC